MKTVQYTKEQIKDIIKSVFTKCNISLCNIDSIDVELEINEGAKYIISGTYKIDASYANGDCCLESGTFSLYLEFDTISILSKPGNVINSGDYEISDLIKPAKLQIMQYPGFIGLTGNNGKPVYIKVDSIYFVGTVDSGNTVVYTNYSNDSISVKESVDEVMSLLTGTRDDYKLDRPLDYYRGRK